MACEQHLFGPTLACLMCGAPRVCARCGLKHEQNKSHRREVMRFLSMLREMRGIAYVAMRNKQIIETIVEMTNLMLEGGPEVPPSEEEIACYVKEFIEYARRQFNRATTKTNDSDGDGKQSAS